MTRSLTIAHLYPAQMNIYGDRGNVIALRRRIEWRGIDAHVQTVAPDDPFDPLDADLIFGGGGQDAGQVVVADDLQRRRAGLAEACEAGVPMLAICGTYQLFGHRFVTADGAELPGVGIFDLETRGGEGRLIGNVVVDSAWGRLVGFENHGGRTWLAPTQEPLGTVVKGAGNNGKTGEEGAVRAHVVGTYLHGPVLPKNPGLADALISRALERRYGPEDLTALDDELETTARDVAATRPR